MALSKEVEAAIREYVAEVVAKAPPVTPERYARLARLIRPPRTPRPRRGPTGDAPPTPARD
jgi:hypothetical protein